MKTTTKLNTNTIKSLIKDESMATKMYAGYGKKYHDPVLSQMARDEHRHHEYWESVMKAKKKHVGGFRL